MRASVSVIVGDVLKTYRMRDTRNGRKAYAAMLNGWHRELQEDKSRFKDNWDWKEMKRGWVHGDEDFRHRMLDGLKERGIKAENVADREQKRDISTAAATAVCKKCLKHFGCTADDLQRMPKSDPRELLIAGLLRYHFPVSTRWVSEKLCMGHFTTGSRAMRFYDRPEGKWKEEKKRILRFIG